MKLHITYTEFVTESPKSMRTGTDSVGPAPLSRRLPYLLPWLTALAVLLIYYPATNNGLVWDDHKAFVLYPYYQQIEFLGRAFTEPLIFLDDYYRPLTSASYIIQIHLLGMDLFQLHLVSLLIHVINTALVGLLATRLGGKQAPGNTPGLTPVIAAAFFGFHPALIESVAWISVRYDLLCTFFMLLALLADSTTSNRIARPLLVGLLFLLAALSKEMAVALALMMPFWHLARANEYSLNPALLIRRMHDRGDTVVYATIVISGLLYLLVRYNALGYLVTDKHSNVITGGSTLSHLLLVFRTYAEYLSLILVPFHQLGPAHPIKLPLAAGNPANWLIMIGILLAISAALFAIHRKQGSGWLFIGMLASLIPVANIAIIYRHPGSFFAESYLVFPVAVFSFFLVVLLKNISALIPAESARLASLVKFLLGVFWLIISVSTIHATIPLWKNDIILWTWASSRYPQSITAWNNLANELNQTGQYAQAEKTARKAITLDTNHASSWAVLGTALTGLGRYDEAEESFRKSIEIFYENEDVWVALANLKTRQERFSEARDILERIVLPNAPKNISALRLLAKIHEQSGNRQRARSLLKQVIELTASPVVRQQLQQQIESLGPDQANKHE